MGKNRILELIETGKISPEKMIEYATSNDYDIAYAVASSKYTESEVLEISALDADSSIRKAVAENTNASIKTLTKLMKDKDESVSKCAKLKLEGETNEVVL